MRARQDRVESIEQWEWRVALQIAGRRNKNAGMQQRILGVILCFGLAGCTAQHYRKSADKAVAKLVAEKTPLVPNMDPRFTIEPTNSFSLEDLPIHTKPEEAFGPETEAEAGARTISLEKSLEIAVKLSRIYQTQKEQLYLQALALSLARHQYTPIFVGRARSDYQVNTEQATTVVIDPVTLLPKAQLSDSLVEQHRIAQLGLEIGRAHV